MAPFLEAHEGYRSPDDLLKSLCCYSDSSYCSLFSPKGCPQADSWHYSVSNQSLSPCKYIYICTYSLVPGLGTAQTRIRLVKLVNSVRKFRRGMDKFHWGRHHRHDHHHHHHHQHQYEHEHGVRSINCFCKFTWTLTSHPIPPPHRMSFQDLGRARSYTLMTLCIPSMLYTWLYQLYIYIYTGWWLGHPSEKYEFVNWDDDIPNSHGKRKLMFQSTNQYIYIYINHIYFPLSTIYQSYTNHILTIIRSHVYIYMSYKCPKKMVFWIHSQDCRTSHLPTYPPFNFSGLYTNSRPRWAWYSVRSLGLEERSVRSGFLIFAHQKEELSSWEKWVNDGKTMEQIFWNVWQ